MNLVKKEAENEDGFPSCKTIDREMWEGARGWAPYHKRKGTGLCSHTLAFSESEQVEREAK